MNNAHFRFVSSRKGIPPLPSLLTFSCCLPGGLLQSVLQQLHEVFVLPVLRVIQRGFPLLVLDIAVRPSRQEQRGDGATPQPASHVQGGVAREITAVQVAVGLWEEVNASHMTHHYHMIQ